MTRRENRIIEEAFAQMLEFPNEDAEDEAI